MLFLAASVPLVAQEELTRRVQQLESQVRQLTDEVIQLRSALRVQEKTTEQLSQTKSPRQELIYDEVIASFLAEDAQDSAAVFYRKLIHSQIWLGGYVDVLAEARESVREQSIFSLSHLALSMRSSLSEELSVQAQVVITEADTVSVAQAYLLVSFDALLSAKFGVLKLPWGKYNSEAAPPAQELATTPWVDQYIIPTVWSDPGVAIFGNYQNLALFSLGYEVMVSSGFSEGGFSGITGNRKARQGLAKDNNDDLQWSGRLEIIPKLGLDVFAATMGISGVIGQYDARAANEFRGLAWDWYVTVGPFSLIGDQDRLAVTGEYVRLDLERDGLVRQKYPDISSGMVGYYWEVQYHFFLEQWRRKFVLFGDQSRFVVSFRHERGNLDKSKTGAGSADDQEIYTLGFNFHPIEQTVVRIEYNWISEFVSQKRAWNNRVLVSMATYF